MLGHRGRRRTAALTTLALVAGLMGATVAVAPTASAAGPSPLSLTKSASGSVLPGTPITYSLQAGNPGAPPATAPQYNVAFWDSLAPGVQYTPGSTTPASVGDPTISVVGVGPAAHQVLVWENVSDLQLGSGFTLGFTANPDPVALPAGSVVANSAMIYANTDPRVAPHFDGTGTIVPASFTDSVASNTVSTSIVPITVSKSEPSPEGKLLRGIHSQNTVYTVKVTNSSQGSTTGTTAVDYLPANQEFLGCGALDNTSAGVVEYPGAPRLTATAPVPGCVMPDQVATVLNPVTTPALPPGVYTRLTWNLGTLAAGQTVVLPYRAGIPLRENTMTFTGGTPTGATAQAANLDNNNGPSTRELSPAAATVNSVFVAGTYTGAYVGSPTPGATPVSASTSLSRRVMDLAMTKSVSPTQFVQGQVATYTLTVRGSEYASSGAVVISDAIPDGLCPLDNTGNHSPDGAAECASGPAPTISGSPTSAIAFSSVTWSAGKYTVVFSPFSVPANGVVTITYAVKMRATYQATGAPTVSGDSYVNNVSFTGVTTPIPASPESGPQTVTDSSSATIASGAPSISKLLLPSGTTPYVCPTPGYADSGTLADPQRTFALGDRVCFKIRVQFPAATTTRNPVLTDFLPAGTAYEPGSMTLTGANTVPAGQVSFNEAAVVAGTANPTWVLGAPSGSSDFVAAGQVFEAYLAVKVVAPAPTRAWEIRGNLAKLRADSTDGTVFSLRARQDFNVAATPQVSITKGVASVNGGPPNPVNTDNVTVAEGDQVTFRVDVTNSGVAANGSNIPVSAVTVWDVLPPGITCANVSVVSDGGACNAPGVLSVADLSRSTISWTGLSPALAPGASRTLTYQMAIPLGTGASTNLVNTASVRSFQATSDTGVVVPYYPASNVDTTVPAASQLSPVASDPSNVRLPAASLTKTGTTAITDTNNNTASQATIGEGVTYTVLVTVPAHTTVYNGSLTDPMPTGLTVLSVSGLQSLTGGPPVAGLPGGFTASSTTTSATLTFPATYQNTTASNQQFGLTINARVSTAASNTDGTVRTNTSTFASRATLGGTALPAATSRYSITVVVPRPTLAKTSSVASAVAGQTITYTLTASNTAGKPTSYDTVVVDCVPAGLTFGSFTVVPQGTTNPPTPGTGTNGCAVGTTMLGWNVGSVVASTPLAAKYTATVDPAAAGSASYTNTATLTGSTLNDGVNDCSVTSIERCVTASAARTVTVAPVAVTKATSTPTRAIGQAAAFTVTATVPAGINYYNASMLDQLPAGLDPTSLTTTGVTCSPSCSVPGTALTSVPLPGGVTGVGWYLGDLPSAPTARTITVSYTAVVADVPANTRGTALSNSATVKWNLTSAPTPPTSAGATFDRGSTAAVASVTVVEPHVVLTKAVSNGTPQPGQSFTYTVTATNGGASSLAPAQAVVVVDTVPTGVVVAPATITGGGVLTGAGPNGGGTITWTVPSIAVNGSVSFSYAASLAASGTLSPAALVNSADATYHSLPGGSGRFYDDVTPATASVTPAFPNVTAAKTAVTAGPAYLGKPFVWQVLLTSTGAGTAYGVGATDTLPAGWSYTPGSAIVSVNGGPATQVDPVLSGAVSTGQVLTWSGLGTLATGQVASITLTTTPTPAVLTDPGVGGSVPQTNTVVAAAADATGADHNQAGPYVGPPATATARILSADVSVTKTVMTAPVAGGSGSWGITVSNNGPDTASGPFTVVDTLPAGVSFTSATGSGWSCSAVGQVVTCVRSNAADVLASGSSFPAVVVTVAVPAGTAPGTSLVNDVTVSAATYDPKLSNNTASSTATVLTAADLSIVKAVSGAVVAGAPITYTLSVSNAGPSDSTSVQVLDPLPASVTFTSASGTGWTCSVVGPVGSQTLTCTRPSLAAGAVAPQIVLVGALSASQTAAVVNTATVSSATPDPNPGNNSSTVTTTPGTSADLVLAKTHVGSLVAGQSGTYQFAVTNTGPSAAAGPLTLTDTLPAGLTYRSVTTADGWACSATGQLVTCTRPAGLASGAGTTFRIAVDVDQSVTGAVVNTATVSSPTPDPVPSNNTSTDSTTAGTSADLLVTKTGPVSAVAGTGFSYTLSVANAGPSRASNVVLSDALPAGLTFVSASGAGWVCTFVPSPAPGSVSCSLPSLDAGAAAPAVTVAVTVSSDVTASTLSNTASVSSDTPDPNPGNNTSTAVVRVDTSADLSVVKSLAGGGPVTAGTSASFTLAVGNAGPSDAAAVLVSDPVPAGMTATAASGTGWSCAVTAVSVTCSRPTLAAGTSAPPITVSVLVSASAPTGTTLVNTASVSSTTPDPDPRNNTSSVSVPVVTSADLSVVKTHPATPVLAGGTVTFNIAVHNAGPSDTVAPVTVVDTLPVGMSFVSSSGPWVCATDPVDPQQVSCVLGPVPVTSVSAGADAPALSMVVLVSPATAAGVLVNTAKVSAPTPDPNPGNNTSADPVTIGASADLSVVKTHTGPVKVGAPVTFDLAVHNAGPSDAHDVLVTDPLPTGLSFVSATGAGWSCSALASVVSCTMPTLAAGGSTTVQVVATVGATAFPSVTNTATVSSSTPDPDPGNNTSSDVVSVPALVDLALTKTHTGDGQVGDRLMFTLTASNHGPTADPGVVTVTDTLPTGLSFVSGSGSGWSCSVAGQVVTCLRAAGLSIGESSAISLWVLVGPAAYPNVVNTASVSSAAVDTDPSNNTASDPVTVSPSVHLSLAKSVVGTASTTAVTWALTVTNHGPNATTSDVVVADTLPATLSYVGFQGLGWSCAAVGQVVTCVHSGVVAVGAAVSVQLSTSVAASAAGSQVVNSAQIVSGSSAGTDPQDLRASASATIPTTSQNNNGDLPHTGADVLAWLLLGCALLMVGGSMLAVAHPRRR